MGGVTKLVDRRHLFQREAAADQNARVARKTLRIAGDRHRNRNLRARELAHLRGGADARRIEEDGVEVLEFFRSQGIVEEIAPVRLNRLRSGQGPGGLLQGGDRFGVVVEGVDARDFAEAQGEGPGAAKEIGDALRPCRSLAAPGG